MALAPSGNPGRVQWDLLRGRPEQLQGRTNGPTCHAVKRGTLQTRPHHHLIVSSTNQLLLAHHPALHRPLLPPRLLSPCSPAQALPACPAPRPFRLCVARASWPQKDTKNVKGRAKALLRQLRATDGSRTEVVKVLDAWAAFQQDFPLLATKCAIEELRRQGKWERVVQVCKWMLSQGHGKTHGTFLALLEALSRLERDAEVDSLWYSILEEHLENMPRAFIERVMGFYLERRRPLKVVEMFGSIDELGVRLNESTLSLVLGALRELNAEAMGLDIEQRYSKERIETRMSAGKRTQVKSFGA